MLHRPLARLELSSPVIATLELPPRWLQYWMYLGWVVIHKVVLVALHKVQTDCADLLVVGRSCGT